MRRTRIPHTPFNAPARQRGLSMVELMISLGIGLLLLAGLSAVFISTSRNRAELDKAGRQIENGRYAMQLLATDVQHAGFYGQYYDWAAPSTIPDDCTSSAPSVDVMRNGMQLPLFGYVQPSAAPACVSATSLATGNDMLVVRRASTTAEVKASQAGLYIQPVPDSCVLGKTANGSLTASAGTPCRVGDLDNLKPDGVTAADIRKYLVHVYFIDNINGVPTLRRMAYGNSGYAAESLVEGIERMALDYGIDTDGNGSPDSYTHNPSTAGNWANVVTVRITLLARNTEASPDHTDTKTYALGGLGTVGPIGDHYKRHVYTQIVRVANVGIRRESEP